MSATTTRVLLLAKARRYADFVGGGSSQAVFSDADFYDLINESAAEYYDLLVAVRGHEYSASQSTTFFSGGNIVPGQSVYTLPVDFYQLISIVLEWNSLNHELLRPLDTFLHAPLFASLSNVWTIGSPKGFRITSSQAGTQAIQLFPAPGSAPLVTRARYVPTFTPLPDDATTLNIVSGFDKLIALGAAIEARGIKNLPTAHLEQQLDKQLTRLQTMANERLADQPERVVDVSPEASTREPWPPPRFM